MSQLPPDKPVNPFQDFSMPADFAASPFMPAPFSQHSLPPRGLVGHVGVIAALMIGQGVLMLLFGGMMLIGFLVFKFNPNIAPPNRQGEPDLQIMSIIMGGMAFVALTLAILFIVTGILNFQFRARTLGITTLFLGLASMLTVYCTVTAIPLVIYGLIVYFNESVALAFAHQSRASG